MFDHEVTVEQRGLCTSQHALIAVQMVPARLHHADIGFIEVRNGLAQERRPGLEVRVEDAEQLAPRRVHARLERAGLEPDAALAPQDDGVDPLGAQLRHLAVHELAGVVRGVVEHLHLEPVSRPIESADGSDQSGSDRPLVVERQLDGDEGHLARGQGLDRSSHAPLEPRQVGQPVQAVEAEEGQNDAVADEER